MVAAVSETAVRQPAFAGCRIVSQSSKAVRAGAASQHRNAPGDMRTAVMSNSGSGISVFSSLAIAVSGVATHRGDLRGAKP